ncbi:phosphate acyltransferase PlsX [Scatolibacter rhodanostii]|uniref:phosphate acyltransferase PlsX n=1 Tax=Scatolibacter rhodanostii TaxID=2014781 RepID=UPI000C07EABC|nr:phosphate acyltransferase PlsX [Scatolibacter rhodanostii]
MKIIVDAFGGDNAPGEILKGCVQAAEELGIEILLSGNRAKIEQAAKELELTEAIAKMEILECDDVISMHDEPTSVIKEKANSSMAVGLKALADGKGDAFASAGNSGALVVGSTMIVKRIKGIKRVTFAPVMPKSEGFFMLSDGGANVDCRPIMLLQFAQMGTAYMKHVMKVKNPRVGLVNVGEEDHKGDELRIETNKLMKEAKDINFVGNIEGRDVPLDGADIVIADGFTGNVILKVYEGVATAVMSKIKGIFTKSLKNKLAAAAVMGDMKELKKSMDYHEHGGAPIMGATKPVFKIHGSAKAKTVASALRLTKNYVESGVIDIIAETVSKKSGGEDETA